MRNKLFIFLSLLAGALFFFGCKPTPNTEVLVKKDENEMLQKAMSGGASTTSLEKQYDIPSTLEYRRESKDKRVLLDYDAAILVPNLNGMPILRLQPADFSQDIVYTLFNTLCGSTGMWQYTSERTKGEIESIIKDLQDNLNGDVEDEQQKELTDALTSWEKGYLSAPDSLQRVKCDGTLLCNNLFDASNNSSIATYTGIVAAEKFTDPIGKFFQVVNNSNLEHAVVHSYGDRVQGLRLKRDAVLFFANYNDPYANFNYNFAENDSSTISSGLLKTDAVTIADNLLGACGIDYFSFDRVYKMISCEDRKKSAVMVTYSRSFSGAPFAYIDGASSDQENTAAPSWTYETLSVYVSENGVFQFIWQAPVTITQVLTDNAVLLPFSQIVGYASNGLLSKFSSESSLNIDHVNIEIKEASLTLQRIAVQNNFDEGLGIPVWNFFGDVQYFYTDGSQYSPINKNDYIRSLITVNAVDGSIINSDIGY
ncbi:MAG: hypothetical protein BGN88_04905 [Clostridiales bacterium 43-6]|nr:MAG: hypothetical protein BGN88_04905 [Clostridiales bacterium 43-6]